MIRTVRCTIGLEADGRLRYEPIPGTYQNDPSPYDASYGDDRVCVCAACTCTTKGHRRVNWHTYLRHFDTYNDMRPVGCKNCGCNEFEEATDDNSTA